jgi:hypothetical protein
MKLAKQAETIAIGKLTKDRVKDSIERLEEMKDRELSQAIAVLKSIMAAYDEAYTQISVKILQFPPEMINWSKVKELKSNCLAWDKVTEIILEAIPQQNIEKIKRSSNTTKVSEYKRLVNFLMSKISYSYKSRIAYISYWETPKTTTNSNTSSTTSRTTTSSSSQNDLKFSHVFPWAVAVIAIIIGLANGAGWGSLIIGFFALGLGVKISEWFE